MLTTDTAVMLAKYSDWADRVLFEAIAALPEGAAYQESATLFRSMVGTLNHNLQVDLIWRAHLLRVEHGFTSRRDVLHPGLAALAQAQCEVNRWYVGWAQAQTLQTLDERLAFRFVSGQAAEMARGAMFLHIVNHKTYHRGWVAEMFFDHGAKPPQMDLSVYLCET